MSGRQPWDENCCVSRTVGGPTEMSEFGAGDATSMATWRSGAAKAHESGIAHPGDAEHNSDAGAHFERRIGNPGKGCWKRGAREERAR
jgi:hypothetical protein